MLIPKRDALRPSDQVQSVSRPWQRATTFTSFKIYRNGVLHDVVDESEGFVRNRVISLCNLQPDSSWDYAPMA
jgi:hypothetical protein